MNLKANHMQYALRFAGTHFEEVRQHLYPGDNKEAIALALCGRFNDGRVTMLLAHKVLLIPHDECDRREDFIEWPTERAVPFLVEAMNKGFGILKIHSHPGWYDSFSGIDDRSDKDFFSSVYGWTNSDLPHGSAVMLPDGSIFGRMIMPDLSFVPMSKISVAGDQILIWPQSSSTKIDEYGRRTAQLFGDGTYEMLKTLRIGVLGASGTGSIILEQLYRYNVGELVPVDDKPVELRNLNRILNSRMGHALDKEYKVHMIAQAIAETGMDTKVTPFQYNAYDSPEAVKTLATCDVIIGAMDTAEGRHLMNRLSTYYLVPCIDMGISIDSDKKGGIDKIEGSVHYIQPGKSSLLTRGVYSLDQVVAESIFRKNPEEYKRLQLEGQRNGHKYIKDLDVDRPAVISINMQIAAIAMNELLNRLHPYKFRALSDTAKLAIDVTADFIIPEKESDFAVDEQLAKKVGRGDTKILLDLMDFANVQLMR
jgi:molybdopterin/thiamine biosynthesis adenylyltransferase